MRRVLLAGALAFWSAALPALADDTPIAPEHRRGFEQTFLTFPEWFLVHSPAEYAASARTAPPHRFPFLRHVGQLWSSYAAVTAEQARRHAPANPGYHLMIGVIATSTTVEYSLRSLYENTFGRLSWAFAGDLTDEDRYAARVAQDYVDFIRREPWYLYDFGAALEGLWRTPAFGKGLLRKWERRYALTTEYLVKAGYAWLIEEGTRSVYEPARMTTHAVIAGAPAQLPDGVAQVRALDDGRAVLELPRYYGFRVAATALARSGADFVDIAGNSGDILVTIWAPLDQSDFGESVLFEQPLLTMPGLKRVALIVPVSHLAPVLLAEGKGRWTVEHVYDY